MRSSGPYSKRQQNLACEPVMFQAWAKSIGLNRDEAKRRLDSKKRLKTSCLTVYLCWKEAPENLMPYCLPLLEKF